MMLFRAVHLNEDEEKGIDLDKVDNLDDFKQFTRV